VVDAHLERLTGTRASHLHRPDQGMTAVELLVARLEAGAGRDVPAGIEAREGDRVAGGRGEDGGEIAREVAVERSPLERDLVERHYDARTRRAASTTRSTDGM
jgi:hypothetical protein